MKVLAAVCLLFFFVHTTSAQDFEVSITTIQVWIKAIDNQGKPVVGLTASDFEVFEGNQRVTPTCFEEITQDPAGVSAPSVEQRPIRADDRQQNAPSKIVLFVDLLNTSQAEYLYLRERADQFFNEIKKRRIPVMLVALTPTGRLGILERFTTNIDRVRNRFGRLQANTQRDTRVSNARRDISQILRMMPHASPAVKAAENVAHVAKQKEEQEAEGMLDALEAFQGYWSKNYSEHAVVLYASGGVNAEPGRQYYEMIAAFRADMDTLGTLEARSSSIDTRTRLKKVVSQLNRSNLTFYTLNTRGPVGVVNNIYESNPRLVTNTNYLHDYQEFQDVIAKETGGLSFRNSMNFESALQTMLTDISHYYVICYSPPPHKEPNQYHKIKVRTNKKGVELRYRAGYID